MKLSARDRIDIETAERCDRQLLENHAPSKYARCFAGEEYDKPHRWDAPHGKSGGSSEFYRDRAYGPYRHLFTGPADGYSRG